MKEIQILTQKMLSEKQKWFELLMVILTGCLKFIFMDWMNLRSFYISGICIFWFCYVIYRYSKDHEILKYWGYRKENFKKSMVTLLPFLLISVTGTFIHMTIKDRLVFSWHLIPILMLYPVWGIIQQFMMVSLIAGNLQSLKIIKLNKYQSILITAFIFSQVHYPGIFLMIFTFIMEIIFLMVFYKWRNLWALGLVHGWVATILLFYIENRDLWTELFTWL